MNTINMPGFTAESSLYKTGEHFYWVGILGPHEGRKAVVPQFPIIILPWLGYCRTECSPILIYDPITKTTHEELTCITKCEPPVLV